MKRIKKKISLKDYISRVPSFVPYIGYTDEDYDTFMKMGNWGKIPYNIDGDLTGIPYLVGKVWSFNEICGLYHKMDNIIRNSKFYNRIKKGNDYRWVEFFPTEYEKNSIIIRDALPDANRYKYDTVGVGSEKLSDYGGIETFKFLLKVVGLFQVPKKYIKNTNTVPEYMYYAGIDTYLEDLEKYGKGKDCCSVERYRQLGGSDFEKFLTDKKIEAMAVMSDMKSIVKMNNIFWDIVDEVGSKNMKNNIPYEEYMVYDEPTIDIPISLEAQSKHLGLYTVCDLYEDSEIGKEKYDRLYNVHTKENSKLKNFRSQKISFDDKVPGKVIKEAVIDTNDRGDAKLAPLYRRNIPVNISGTFRKENKDYVVGDMIYDMRYRKKYMYDNLFGFSIDIAMNPDGTPKNPENTLENELQTYKDNGFFIIDSKDFNGYYEGTENDPTSTSDNGTNGSSMPSDKILVIDMEPERLDSTDAEGKLVYYINKYSASLKVYNHTEGDVDIKYVMQGNILYDKKLNKYIYSEDERGVKFKETRKWKTENLYGKYNVRVGKIENIFTDGKTANLKELVVIDDDENVVSDVTYRKSFGNDFTDYPVIMEEENIGKIDLSIDRGKNFIMNRGYANAFELHSKLGEVNTFEDMKNYQNNFFKLD